MYISSTPIQKALKSWILSVEATSIWQHADTMILDDTAKRQGSLIPQAWSMTRRLLEAKALFANVDSLSSVPKERIILAILNENETMARRKYMGNLTRKCRWLEIFSTGNGFKKDCIKNEIDTKENKLREGHTENALLLFCIILDLSGDRFNLLEYKDCLVGYPRILSHCAMTRHVIVTVIKRTTVLFPIFKSGYCNLFEDRVPGDFIFVSQSSNELQKPEIWQGPTE